MRETCKNCIWFEDGWCDEHERFVDEDSTCPFLATGYPKEEDE